MIRTSLILALFAVSLSSGRAAEPPKTYSADDVRAAFRIGILQGMKEERDRQTDAVMSAAAKGAPNVLQVLQPPSTSAKP